MSPRLGDDLYQVVAAAVAGLGSAFGRSTAGAVLFWGDHPEAEVVHARDLPEPICRALTTAGGRHVARAIRSAGAPLRIPSHRLPADARGLRDALVACGAEALAVFPLFGERGVVGCVVWVIPEGDGPSRPAAAGEGWRVACRLPEALQLRAVNAALEAALAHDRRNPPELYDGVLVLDRWERVLLADGLFWVFPGWNREDPFGRSLDALPGMSILADLKASAQRLAWEEHVLPPIEGHGVPVALSASPFIDAPAGQSCGKIVFLRDLRPEAGERGDGTARMLGLALRAAHAADELGRALERGEARGPALLPEPLLEDVGALVERADALVRQVLERCLGARERHATVLNDVFRDLCTHYGRELEREGVRVFRFLADDLPAVPGDRLEIFKIFRRLILDARESLRPAGGSMTLRTWVEDDLVCGAVSDDGTGRRHHDPEQIAEPLFDMTPEGERLDELAEVRRLVEGRGGRLIVESRPSVWSRVTVMLPRERRRVPRERAPSTRAEAEGAALAVLVVDDNAALRSVLRRFLERRGHEVTEAVDGEDALRALQGGRFDRVIVDIHMPVKDGPAFFESLEAVAPHMRERTIFMTGGFLEARVEQFLERTGRPAISKPFDLAELARTLEG